MTPLLFVAASLAGGVGSAARYGITELFTIRGRRRALLATLLINFSGSLALGFLQAALPGESALLKLTGAGLLGGFTTFSTVSIDTVALLRSGRFGRAALNALGSLAVCLVGASAGILLPGLS